MCSEIQVIVNVTRNGNEWRKRAEEQIGECFRNASCEGTGEEKGRGVPPHCYTTISILHSLHLLYAVFFHAVTHILVCVAPP